MTERERQSFMRGRVRFPTAAAGRDRVAGVHDRASEEKKDSCT